MFIVTNSGSSLLGSSKAGESKLSMNRKMEKERPCEEMEASRGGGGEVRKVHIVYFLSRDGKREQPHLIRVHHISRSGVYLRDVKLWLSELRGEDMPDSFAWSYKRKYRAGYVWQDLTDDELITPISDNEYILKGSHLHLKNKTMEEFLNFNEQSATSKELYFEEDREEEDPSIMPKTLQETLRIDGSISPKPPPHADHESPASASSPSKSSCRTRQTAVFKIDSWKEEIRRVEEQRSNNIVAKKTGSRTSGSRSYKAHGDPTHHRRASEMLRNILRCRRVDVNDSALKTTREQEGLVSQSNHKNSSNGVDRKSWENKGNNGSWRKGERAAPAMYRPVAEPNCSQCGKPFKPERLHSHMKSCKVLKEKARSGNFNREKLTERSELSSKTGVSKVTVTVP